MLSCDVLMTLAEHRNYGSKGIGNSNKLKLGPVA